jgi:Leucine-rich repeat (LRR) protein
VGLVILQALNLPYNNITTIPSDKFEGLTFLKYLNLAKNKVTTISDEIPRTLNSLVCPDLVRNT